MIDARSWWTISTSFTNAKIGELLRFRAAESQIHARVRLIFLQFAKVSSEPLAQIYTDGIAEVD